MAHRFLEYIGDKKTPFYLYDMSLLNSTLQALTEANKKHNFHIHYAVKANADDHILEAVRDYNLGADCVSGNEVKHAIEQGFKAEDVVFAGVGKSDDELKVGLELGIGFFNCESMEEIRILNEFAGEMNRKVNIAIRINPNIEAGTHEKITTGLSENKFGLTSFELEELFKCHGDLENVNICGAHFHIGSQINNMQVFKNLAVKAGEFVEYLEGKGLCIEHINLGGGLGIDYEDPDGNPIPDFASYFNALSENLRKRENQTVHLELGRSIVGQCGNLVSRVLFVKKGEKKQFAILDAGMTELMRPALYDSVHKIENMSSEGDIQEYDVVGPVCESSDTFARDLELPESKRGDIMLIRSAGAYGVVMKSSYNLRELENSLYI